MEEFSISSDLMDMFRRHTMSKQYKQYSPKHHIRPYLVFGGWIKRVTDGQEHYISPARVMELYGLKRHECFFFQDEEDSKLNFIQQREKYIEYHPDPSGRYSNGCCIVDGYVRTYPILDGSI